MPCDTVEIPGLSLEERSRQLRDVTERIAQGIADGKVRVSVSKVTGAVTFQVPAGFDRAGMTDACTFRRLQTHQGPGAFEYRRALATAEALAGRKAAQSAGAGLLHTHDGGRTWGRH